MSPNSQTTYLRKQASDYQTQSRIALNRTTAAACKRMSERLFEAARVIEQDHKVNQGRQMRLGI